MGNCKRNLLKYGETMTEPRTLELQFIKAEDFLAVHPGRGRTMSIKPFGMKIHMISDCLCMGGVSQVVIPVMDGKMPYVFKESSDYPDTHSLLSVSYKQGLEHPIVELGEAVPLYPLYAFHNFWHWIFEGLPRLLIMEKYGYKGVYIIARGIPFILDILDMLGIDENRLRFNNSSYMVHKLLLPHPWLAETIYLDNPALFFLVRNTLLDAVEPLPGSKRCYIRRAGSKRRVLNEADVLKTLEGFDFVIMTPEELPAREQIRIMTNVSFSVMPHGANVSLAALQQRDSAFIELFSHQFFQAMNLFMAKHLGMLYVPLCAELTGNTPPPFGYDQDADILVDCKTLEVIVENMIRHTGR